MEVVEKEEANFDTEISEEDVAGEWKLRGQVLMRTPVRTPDLMLVELLHNYMNEMDSYHVVPINPIKFHRNLELFWKILLQNETLFRRTERKGFVDKHADRVVSVSILKPSPVLWFSDVRH